MGFMVAFWFIAARGIWFLMRGGVGRDDYPRFPTVEEVGEW